MKSNKISSSDEKITKATELLWKFWWFTFYLIIVPSLVAVVGFFIYFFIGKDPIVSVGLSVITFMFVLLFFYKAFDKYRKIPFFSNKLNNLSARINIVFLITILALIVTPIFVLFTPGDNYFELLPLISFSILYNIVYYYYYFQPIDFFDPTEEKFNHAISSSQIIRQPYNIMVAVNYIVHIVFLSYTFNTKVSWLFPLIWNIIFYVISRLSCVKICKNIAISIDSKKTFLEDLIIFKKKFVNSLLGLAFVLLIQMPFVIVIVYILVGIHHDFIEIINISLLSLVFLAFYFKIRLYISSFYSKFLRRIKINEF
ncbi:MAG TPA: hypothetical protein VMV43_04905 [Candidatus Nanopelagicaceae bacterium]|nr:hypothetical protein [Candidatus Nanopelagicaceae bacterium]